MTLQIRTADFRRAVLTASRVVERRNTIPVLSTVKCVANGALEVTGTDLDMSITARVPREAGEHIEFALMSAREVVSALASAGGDSAKVSYGGGKVSVSSGALSLEAGALPVDDFPAGAEREPEPTFSATLSKDHLAALARVAGAMSVEETRYYLNGVNLVARPDAGFGVLRFQATDGHRLYFADVVCPDAIGELAENIILPRKLVSLLLDLGRPAEDGIRMSVGRVPTPNVPDGATIAGSPSGPRVAFSFATNGMTVRLVSKPIDGTFPDVNRVIPSVGGVQILLNTADVVRALGAVSGFSKAHRAVRIELNADETATLSASMIGLSLSTSVTVPCKHDRPGFVVGYNGNYLRSIISAARGEEVVMDVADPAAPTLIRNPADPDWTGVLMPMRV